jgi:hypothetical protein
MLCVGQGPKVRSKGRAQMAGKNKEPQPRNLGHGFVEGPDAWHITKVAKARKTYVCDGPMRAVRDDDGVSPGTGDALFCEPAMSCVSSIEVGDLYVHLLPHDVESFGSYWAVHRVCIECSLGEQMIRRTE